MKGPSPSPSMFLIFAKVARPVALLVLFSTSSILTIAAPVAAFTVSSTTLTKRNCQFNGNTKIKKQINRRPTSYSDVNHQDGRWLLQQLFSSPNNNEEEIVGQKQVKTFDQAGRSLIEEEDEAKLREMGDFDSNPESKEANMERMREAIRLRTADMGLEKSKLSQEYFQELSRKSKEEDERVQQGGAASDDELDLSQISSEPMVAGSKTGNRGERDKSLPNMLYNPEDEMSEEEMKEVDKVGNLPIYEQVVEELKNAKWPTLGAATREVGLLFIIVGLTGAIIINWDQLLRNVYTDLGFIPSADTIESSFSKIDFLPEGWTNGMNEQDVANLQDEIATTGKNLDISQK